MTEQKQNFQYETLLEIRDMTEGLANFNETYFKINAMAKKALDGNERKVRYFEIKEPYYALVKATSKEDAFATYVKETGIRNNEMLLRQMGIQEVSYDYALALYSLLAVKKGNQLLVSQVLEWFRKDEVKLLVNVPKA